MTVSKRNKKMAESALVWGFEALKAIIP